MTGLRVDRYADVEEYLARAGDFLTAREAEHNLILGICTNIHRYPELFVERPPTFLVVIGLHDRVAAASLRTPPFNQVLSEMKDVAAAEVIADAVADAAEDVPGVLGPPAAAGAFGRRWSAKTGARVERTMAERIFRLSRVIWPRPAPGSWRLAEERDRRLIRQWILAFNAEAMPREPPPDDVDGLVDRFLRRIGRTVYLWEADGEPVCLVGAGSETPNGVRIGPVYTPPERRGRGYASNLTAAVSRAQLDAGRRFCFLYTDLANPTSNTIYQAIGYEPVTDADQYRFEPS